MLFGYGVAIVLVCCWCLVALLALSFSLPPVCLSHSLLIRPPPDRRQASCAAHVKPKRRAIASPSMTHEMFVIGQRLCSTAPATASAAACFFCVRVVRVRVLVYWCFERGGSAGGGLRAGRTAAALPFSSALAIQTRHAQHTQHAPHAAHTVCLHNARARTCGRAPRSSFDSRKASMASSNAPNWLVGYVCCVLLCCVSRVVLLCGVGSQPHRQPATSTPTTTTRKKYPTQIAIVAAISFRSSSDHHLIVTSRKISSCAPPGRVCHTDRRALVPPMSPVSTRPPPGCDEG